MGGKGRKGRKGKEGKEEGEGGARKGRGDGCVMTYGGDGRPCTAYCNLLCMAEK